MDREILFRGKRIDNGEWVKGLPFSFHANNNVEGIETYDGERHKVDPDTVGQYTGLTDKNGKKVFEGDIIFNPYSCVRKPFKVVWFRGGLVRYSQEGHYFTLPESDSNPFEIIGNIHDNPELLEGD